MTQLLITIIAILLGAIGLGTGIRYGKAQKNRASIEHSKAQKYKTQRDESRATARILVEHQEAVQDVRQAGAEIVKEIQDAKTEDDAIDIIARLTTDWNAGL